MVDILKEIGENKFQEGLPKRLTIDGVTREYKSYKIPIEYLYYNDLNGRIASYIQEYNDNNPTSNLKNMIETDKEEYNKLISEYIKDSADDNRKSYNDTKQDILAKNQEIPGVVLSDGRIIDGNRRFTAIRDLYKETGSIKFAYFEAVCLETPVDKNQWKRIKTLELYLQFNVEEKKDYNRIDYLVSFYKDVIETKMFNKSTYQSASGIKSSKFNNDIEIVNIMLDYLEWRGKPKAFYILKNEKLDGPIEEIHKKKKKMSDLEWQEKKDYIYAFMTFNDTGDRTRDIRKLCESAKDNTTLFNEYKNNLDKQDFKSKLLRAVTLVDVKPNSVEESKYNDTVKKEMGNLIKKTYNDSVFASDINKASNEPIILLDNILKQVQSLNGTFINNLSTDNKKKIDERISEIIDKLNELSK